ncbi:MAG: DUF5348 domain-containing protein [Oscillospiraceae bacterium]|nr:DUF5348 domain-containing protein [Oscillospiraceae bacterium]
MKIAELTKKLKALNGEIKAVLRDSGFAEYNEFYPDEYETSRKTIRGEDGYEDNVADLTADEWLRVYEYEKMLDQLDTISDRLTYLDKPITYEGTLYKSASGRYGCDYHEFTCGNRIEFQKYDEEHDCYYWVISRVEFSDDKGGYYIYGHSSTPLDGLKVRFRW